MNLPTGAGRLSRLANSPTRWWILPFAVIVLAMLILALGEAIGGQAASGLENVTSLLVKGDLALVVALAVRQLGPGKRGPVDLERVRHPGCLEAGVCIGGFVVGTLLLIAGVGMTIATLMFGPILLGMGFLVVSMLVGTGVGLAFSRIQSWYPRKPA
jgi:hypothetical protein